MQQRAVIIWLSNDCIRLALYDSNLIIAKTGEQHNRNVGGMSFNF